MDVFLVKKAQRGNKDAFVKLMQMYEQDMLKVAYGFFQNEHDVADAVSETILSAYEHITELKKPLYFKTWLIRILINHCKSMCNRQKRMIPVDQMPESGMRAQYPCEDGFFDLMQMLDMEYRTVFVLYYSEGYNTREIAELLEINENTVKSRLLRGRSKLGKELKEVGYGKI